MPGELNLDLGTMTAVRAQLAASTAAESAASRDLARLQAEQQQAARTGRTLDPQRVEALHAAAAAIQRAASSRRDAEASLRDASEAFVVAHAPERLIASMDAGVPVALLPVRLETRFADDRKTLRVRIYPDQIHIDAHTPEPSLAEIEAATRYWSARWTARRAPAPQDTELAREAWRELVAGREPLRAASAARRLRPVNLDRIGTDPAPQFPALEPRAEDWRRTPSATVLPDRFVAVGFRGGHRLFVRWGGYVPDALEVWAASTQDGTAAPGDGELPLTPGMKWLADYAAAEQAGMAITVSDAHLPQGETLAAGVDQLVVLGVDWTLSPEEAAARFGSLLDSHVHTRGLSFVRAQTPTNHTGDAAVASNDEAAAALALDPFDDAQDTPPDQRADVAFGRSFGLPATVRPLLARVAGGDDLSVRTSGLMLQMLWSAVPGIFLDNFFESHLSDRAIGLLRDHATLHVRAGGPLPTLRSGRQPYGLLPVVARSRFVPDRPDGAEFHLWRVLEVLRQFHWAPGTSKLPYMGRLRQDGSVKVDEDLREILGMTPTAASARFRRMLDPETRGNTQADAATTALWRLQEALWSILFELDTGRAGTYSGPMLSFGSKRPSLADKRLEPTSYLLQVPFVQDGAVGPETPWTENYLLAIAAAVRDGRAGRSELGRRCDGASLLEALAAQSALTELTRVHSGIAGLAQGLDVGALHRRTLSTVALVGTDTAPVASGAVRVETPASLAQVVIPAVTGSRPLDEFVREQIRQPVFLEQPQNRSLKLFLAALDELAQRPPEEIDRAFRSTLDAVSYRLDAWYTSMASRRLQATRARRPEGLYFGAYGWVDDLRPERPDDSEGYVLAPSIQHAITAALLRSGYLTHRGEQNAFNIDLSSDRVRLALYLMSGVAEGQSLAALLGYRFERGLRERGLTLARFILPLRLLCPMRPSGAVDLGQPLESIAARDVVDGVQLLALWRGDRARLAAACSAVDPPATAAETTAIEAELKALENALDAAGDLCVAEGVHQLAGGNLERSGAALAALDRQQAASGFEVVQTPRSAPGFTQRVMVLCGAAAARDAAWDGFPADARARAEPRLDAWVAALLGDPARIRLWARIASRAEPPAHPEQVCECTLEELGMSPLSLVLSAAPQGEGRPTAFEQALARCLWRKVTGAGGDRTMALEPEAPPDAAPGSLGLAACLALLRRIRALVGGCRYADGRDLTVPGEPVQHGLDAAEIGARADVAAAAHDALHVRLQALAAVDDEGLTAADRARAQLSAAASSAEAAAAQAMLEALSGELTGALDAAGDLGLGGAVPVIAIPRDLEPGPADWSEIVRVLADQVAALARRVAAAVQRRTSAEQSFAGRSFEPSDDQVLATVELHRTRLQAVFGDDFPAVPVFAAAAAAEAASSLADQEALLGVDAAYPAAWLAEMSLVREAVGTLSEALDASELVDGEPRARRLRVVQLPHRPGQRWAALPEAFRPEASREDGGDTPAPPHGCVSAVVAGDFAFNAPVTGFVVDGWQETVPEPEQTVAASFHYDAPGARPPQAILLAVTPDLTQAGWSFEALLDSVREAAELARLRLIGPKQMNALANMLFPVAVLPDSFSKDVPSTHWGALATKFSTSLSRTVLGR